MTLRKSWGYLREVPDRSAATLLPIIQEIVLPGTVIHSDEWAAYNKIANLPVVPPYIHQTVNHPLFFRDPVSGLYTNDLEVFWKYRKMKQSMSGTTPGMLGGYLDEFMRRQYHGKKSNETFLKFLKHIREWYRV